MYRLILVISIALFLNGPTVSMGQTRKPDSSDLVKQLLAMPAPTPRGSPTPPSADLKQSEPDFFNSKNPPPDDAPIEDLLAYWMRWLRAQPVVKPSPTVAQRLLDYGLNKPEQLPTFLRLIPATDKSIAKVKEVYDKDQNEQLFDGAWRRDVKNWLLYKSTHFLTELMALAHKAKDSAKSGHVIQEDALVALAKLDWNNTEPLLRSLLASAQPRSSTLAVSLLYLHAIEEKDASGEEEYRRNLIQIAADHNQPGSARNTAIESLSSTEWSGRDEWYLSQFQDETLIQLRDGDSVYSPLDKLFASNPEKWIPEMARLLESKDVTVRTVAASCLLVFKDPDPRKEALLPLLPWLSNPKWLGEAAGGRVGFIQTMASIEIPESVPGLISIVENEEAGYDRSSAASALARYADPRAVPALKKALAGEKDEANRERILKGLVASHGLDDNEGVEALEAYLDKVKTPEGLAQINRYPPRDGPLELAVSIGKYLSQTTEVPDSLVKAVLARADTLKSENRTLAQDLVNTAHHWLGGEVERDMINRIANGSANADMIAAALTRRETMLAKLRPELERLAAADGIAPGAGAVLLGDSVLIESVLSSGDPPAQTALLACARLTQTPLPVELVASLLSSKNSLLANAAELYLLAEDSHQARELLWRHHPNEAFVTGWRENVLTLVQSSIEDIVKMEEKLRAELFKPDGPVEIFALLSPEEAVGSVLRIYRDKAIYTDYEDATRYRERTVPQAEIATFRNFVTTSGILEMGPETVWCYHGCRTKQFLAISKEKGRRVFSQQGFLSLGSLMDFVRLGDGAKTHYNLEKEIKGLEVLFDDPELTAVDVWQHENGQLRVLVKREEDIEEPEESQDSDDEEEEQEETPAQRLEAVRRELGTERARFSWRVFANRELGDLASQPDGYSVIDGEKFVSTEDDDQETFDIDAQLLTPDSIVIARGNDGLWKQVAGAKPVRLGTHEGGYGNPIVTADRKWVVVGKSDTDWNQPNYVVRLNLQTGREFRIKLDVADEFAPITYLSDLGKVLLRRARFEHTEPTAGPERPEFYLLDAATGVTRLVSGNFEPLNQHGHRFLQAADKPGEYWAAIPDEAKNETLVGRYNVKDFSFKQVLTVPHIIFDSMAMWVDGSTERVYVVYKGQLLRLPLPAAAK